MSDEQTDGPDLKSSENLPVKKVKSYLGEYLIKGGPGRPKGMQNEYTRIKNEMLEVWKEEGGKEKFRQLFHKNFVQALDRIIMLMPKNVSVDANVEITNKDFFYEMARKAGLLEESSGQNSAGADQDSVRESPQ